MKGKKYKQKQASGRLVWTISMRYLRSQKRSKMPSMVTLLSFLSVTIAISTLIVVTSVFNGFETTLTKKVIGFNPHIIITPANEGIEIDEQLVHFIKSKWQEVEQVGVVVEGQGMIVNKDNGFSSGVIVSGIDRNSFVRKAEQFENKWGDEVESFGEEQNSIVISSALASKLGTKLNKQVSLMMPRKNDTIFGPVPKTKTYNVAMIVKTGMYQYDEIYSFLPIEEAENLLSNTFASKSIAVTLKNPFLAEKIAQEIQGRMPEGKYNILNWRSENQSLIEALNIERSVMTMILSLFVCMALFAVFSNVLLMVKEKRKSIAVLCSMGLTKSQVGEVFFIAGIVIGLAGIVAGVATGIGVAANIQTIKSGIEKLFGLDLYNPAIYFLSNLPSDVRAINVIIIATTSFVATVIASTIPAIKASKQLPAEVLRDY